jgi:hypothetical protein
MVTFPERYAGRNKYLCTKILQTWHGQLSAEIYSCAMCARAPPERLVFWACIPYSSESLVVELASLFPELFFSWADLPHLKVYPDQLSVSWEGGGGLLLSDSMYWEEVVPEHVFHFLEKAVTSERRLLLTCLHRWASPFANAKLPFEWWANGKRFKENHLGFRFPFKTAAYIYIITFFIYVYLENRIMGKWQLPFVFAANEKLKRQTFVCFLQTEMENWSAFSLVGK